MINNNEVKQSIKNHFEYLVVTNDIQPSMSIKKSTQRYFVDRYKPIALFRPCGRGSKLLVRFNENTLFTTKGLEKFQQYLNWQYISMDSRRGNDILALHPNDLDMASPKAVRTIVDYLQIYVYGDELFCKEVINDLNYMWRECREECFEC
ncbi:hypothetical protein [Staphylococcus casei]|uniref:Uncharacterized protein n=1 Tax=Staphylococcus casei TaxID=201828 RepID=A0ABZ2WA35_9STAP